MVPHQRAQSRGWKVDDHLVEDVDAQAPSDSAALDADLDFGHGDSLQLRQPAEHDAIPLERLADGSSATILDRQRVH